jgi:hypothetical protein
MVKEFDGHDYTERSVLEELLLIERHARDGSATQAGCACIEEKHLLTLAGLASEMPTLSKDDAEKEYYMKLAELARAKREEILDRNFKGSEKHGLSKCEKKIEKCILSGITEEQCRAEIPCK